MTRPWQGSGSAAAGRRATQAFAGRATARKLAVLHRRCAAIGRDYHAIEKTHVQAWALAPTGRLRRQSASHGPMPSFLGPLSEAIELVGQYQDAGIDLLILSDARSDVETRELFVSDVMPHFA